MDLISDVILLTFSKSRKKLNDHAEYKIVLKGSFDEGRIMEGI